VNDQTDLVKRQIESAAFRNINLKVIEQDGHIVEVSKLKAMKDYVQALETKNDTIVLFVERFEAFIS